MRSTTEGRRGNRRKKGFCVPFAGKENLRLDSLLSLPLEEEEELLAASLTPISHTTPGSTHYCHHFPG